MVKFTDYRQPDRPSPLQMVVLEDAARRPDGVSFSTSLSKNRLIAMGYLELRDVPGFRHPMPALTEKGWAEVKKEGA